MPFGRYTGFGDGGEPVGTEDFRAAPGPMGWRYFSEVETKEPSYHQETLDLAVHADWRIANVRIGGAHELLLQASAGAIGVRRVTRGHAPVVQKVSIGVLRHRGTAPEVPPEVLERAVVLVAERPCALAELREIARLEQPVAGVRRQSAPQVRPEHRHDHRAVAAARLPLDPAVLALRKRPIGGVDERNDLGAEIREVVARAGRESRNWLPPSEVQQSTQTRSPAARRRVRTARRRAPGSSSGRRLDCATCRAGR